MQMEVRVFGMEVVRQKHVQILQFQTILIPYANNFYKHVQ